MTLLVYIISILNDIYCSSEDDVKTNHNGDKNESSEGQDNEDEGEESEDKNKSSENEDSSTDIDFDEINNNNEICKFTRECVPPTLIRYLTIRSKRMQHLSSLMRSLLDQLFSYELGQNYSTRFIWYVTYINNIYIIG